MPKAWLCIPSARDEDDSTVGIWRSRGYGIALFRNEKAAYVRCDILLSGPYPGYAVAANALVREALLQDLECKFVITAGDDIDPDPNWEPNALADHFEEKYGSFSVIQPTSDRWGDSQGAYIDRVAGSPWIGREFAQRAYGGNGPYWPEYTHMGVDEELREVAIKLGVYWERPDLMHFHRHWGRPQPGEQWGQRDRMPAFLAEANSPEHWARYKRIFNDRKAHGFPGHEVKS